LISARGLVLRGEEGVHTCLPTVGLGPTGAECGALTGVYSVSTTGETGGALKS
jgi:hypothetical protein